MEYCYPFCGGSFCCDDVVFTLSIFEGKQHKWSAHSELSELCVKFVQDQILSAVAACE